MNGAGDAAVLERWWRAFAATGTLPDELLVVQRRLVRSVHRGELPSGPVHVKAMTFPRAKDRLRYSLRRLPAAHEAAMLRAVAAAGIACPQVVGAWTARRAGLPHRSLLVVRTLPVDAGSPRVEPDRQLLDEARLATRLLAAGIVHDDLHRANFVRLRDGSLAVLDLQSARHRSPRAALARRIRIGTAARLAREQPGLGDAAALDVLVAAGLVRDGEREAVRVRLAADRGRYRAARVARCFTESTEFTVRRTWRGREYRRRTVAPDGRWWWGGPDARAAWIGQRALQLDTGREPLFTAYFQKWWWLGGGGALYVPSACSDESIDTEVRAATAGVRRQGVR